jgi:hypothetical protein
LADRLGIGLGNFAGAFAFLEATMSEAYKELEKVAADLGLTLDFDFVPQRFDDRTKATDMGLKWIVNVYKDGKRLVLSAEYTQGVAHCESYPKSGRLTLHDYEQVQQECLNGPKSGQPKEPLNALWCIASDCNSLDTTSGFEDWATTFGHDPDSRKAYATWEEINEQYHILKSVIGHDGIERLATVEL